MTWNSEKSEYCPLHNQIYNIVAITNHSQTTNCSCCFIHFFKENGPWHFMQTVTKETICMKCQSIFPWQRDKKTLSTCHLLKFLPIGIKGYFWLHFCLEICYTRWFQRIPAVSTRYILIITKTCLYNFDPLKPHFYIVKLGFTGVYTIFLISAKNIDYVGILTSTHNLCFEQKYEKHQNFCLKTFSFWWWNFQYIWIGVFS